MLGHERIARLAIGARQVDLVAQHALFEGQRARGCDELGRLGDGGGGGVGLRALLLHEREGAVAGRGKKSGTERQGKMMKETEIHDQYVETKAELR